MAAQYNQKDFERAKKLLLDPLWRINHLYNVITKKGKKQQFKLNWAQEDLYKNMWYCNVILKARQLGISTFISLLFLDRCLFNSNMSAGIIAHTREDSEMLFRRVKYAYDNLPEELKKVRRAVTETVRELKFENGSTLRVGTSMRGSTLNYLHVSEFGKICAHYPEKAQEIITGSLNTLDTGQYVFIESTAEGSGGQFYDICQQAQKAEREKLKLSKLDFRFHFYPWWKEPDYVLPEYVVPNGEMKEYFEKLEARQVFLSGSQQAWYMKKYGVLGDSIYSEFPSTPEESFQASASGLFYGKLMTEARLQKRIGNVPYDNNTLVHTAWDLGFSVAGYTAIWFFQICGNEIHIIDFYADYGKSLAEYIQYVKSKNYTYGEHIAPHDIKVHEYSHGFSRWEVARKLGIEFIIAKEIGVISGIEAVKSILPRMWFNEPKCGDGIRMLENYRKDWDERLAKWSEKAVKDTNCHGADALRYLAVALNDVQGQSDSIPKSDIDAIRKYYG